jgi:Na+-transporting NADH:ubiquinone oxidoreductase subunit NqrD
MIRIRGSGSPFRFVLAVTYFFDCIVAFRAEDFERGRRAEDLLVDGVYDGVPVSDALLVVDFYKLLFSLRFRLFHAA